MQQRYPDVQTVAPDGRAENEQPRWRRDFPIDWPQDEYIARRDFSKFLVLTSLAFAVGQFWIVAQSILRRRKSTLPVREVARVDAVPVGGSLLFDYPAAHDPCILVRIEDNRFVAYDQKCTHLSCPVLPQMEAGRFHCPCHEGSFDLATGRPLAGPPRRPLTRIKLEVRDGRIYAAGLDERTS
jgi:nitrite reductase/ring-hydroxylating ferredoxin subunit